MRNKIFALVLLLALAIPCFSAVTFTDLPKDHWAYEYVEKLVVKYGVISGFPDNTYRGSKTLNRYEFSKALVVALEYIEKNAKINLKDVTTEKLTFKDMKEGTWPYPYVMNLVTNYQIIRGYPDGTFKGKNTLNRNEVSVAIARALERVEKAGGFKVTLKTVTLSDMPSDHWAYPDVLKLISAGIIDPYPDGAFKGKEDVSRYLLASVMAKFLDYSMMMLAKKPPPVVVAPPGLIERSITVSKKPEATVSGSFGNIYESNSGTNNWMGFGGAVTYGNRFKILMLSGNYEIAGKYGFNRINYMVPSGGSGGGGSGGGVGVDGGIVNENRYELELNTTYPVVKFFGIDGKLLVGLKYVNFNNPTAPTDFTGFNIGAATKATFLGRDFLVRGFYSLPLSQVNVTPSVLGQPAHLFDYEASLPAEIFSYPVLIGFSGETMTLTGGSARHYNNFFVRYFIM